MSTAQYTLASAAGEKLQDGQADVEVAAGAFVQYLLHAVSGSAPGDVR